MLKLNRVLLAPDANTGGESSVPPDDKVAESLPQEPVEQKSEDTEVEETEETPESEESATEEIVEETTTEQTQETVEEEQEPEVPVNLDKPDDAKLSFHKHARFQELIQEKEKFKRDFEQSKPLVEQARVTNEFLRDNQITSQEYQSALQYLMLLRKDPQQAYAMLKPTYEQLALLSGDRLPADLQAEVAAGTLAQERAQELARARGQQTYQQWRGQQGQQQQQASQVEVITGAIQTWITTKQSMDPDFKPDTPLWEQVDLRIRSMPVFRSAQDAMQGSEKAYADAKKFMGTLTPRRQVVSRSLPKSRGNITNQNQVMKTADDVMHAIARGAKPHQLRYS